MEEAAKQPVPDGRFVKVQCATRACPGLSSGRGVGRLHALYRGRAFAVGMAIHNETLANQHVPQAREKFDLLLRHGRRDAAV